MLHRRQRLLQGIERLLRLACKALLAEDRRRGPGGERAVPVCNLDCSQGKGAVCPLPDQRCDLLGALQLPRVHGLEQKTLRLRVAKQR